MKADLRFQTAVPDGFKVLEREVSLTGTRDCVQAIRSFARKKSHTVTLRRVSESGAIHVIGLSRGWLSTRRYLLGQLPETVATRIVDQKLDGCVMVCLKNIWAGRWIVDGFMRDRVGVLVDVFVSARQPAKNRKKTG